MEGITANKKNIANDKAKDRVRQRLELLEKRPVYLPKMPAWKINAQPQH